eukprot:scaffold2190_cov118-Isochrysis_galbana.AAC.3
MVSSRLPPPEADADLAAARTRAEAERPSSCGTSGRCHHRRLIGPPMSKPSSGLGSAPARPSHRARARSSDEALRPLSAPSSCLGATTRSNCEAAQSGRCTCTVAVIPPLALRSATLAGTLARPQLMASSGNAEVCTCTPMDCGPSTACAASWARSGRRMAAGDGTARTSVWASPSASASATACFSAPAAPLPRTSTEALDDALRSTCRSRAAGTQRPASIIHAPVLP